MLRGVNKKVIVIKNPPGDVFEEAYFILKTNRALFKPSSDDLVLQANRILASCTAEDEKTSASSAKDEPVSSPDFARMGCPDPVAVAGRSRAAANLIKQEKRQSRRFRNCMMLSFVGGLLLMGAVSLAARFYF